MAEVKLTNVFEQALSVLNKAFADVAFDGQKVETLNLKHFVEEYSDSQKNAVTSIAEYLSSSSKTITKMRSSYLPQDLFPSLYSDTEAMGVNVAGVSLSTVRGIDSASGGNFTEMESYENAFMRMLGMPMSDDSRLKGKTISFLDPKSKSLIGDGKFAQTIEALEETVLNERQKNILTRSRIIDDAIFNKDESALAYNHKWTDVEVEAIKAAIDGWKTFSEQKAKDKTTGKEAPTLTTERGRLMQVMERTINNDENIKELYGILNSTPKLRDEYLSTVKTATEGGGNVSDAINKFLLANKKNLSVYTLHEDFYSFKYLLFPPVQDARISKCLNEPEKIVSRPFYGASDHVNSKKIRMSLLEAIIRIRMDRGSGAGPEIQDLSLDSSERLNPNTFGVLEALVIVRLQAAVEAYSVNIRDDLESLSNYASKLHVAISEHEARNAQASLLDGRAPIVTYEDDSFDGEFLRKSHSKTVETAILTLFGNTNKVPGLSSVVPATNGNVLDSQVGGLRTSSVLDAHLLAPTLGIVGLPLKAINDRLQEMRDGIERSSGPDIKKSVAGIRTILGSTNGVGAIDVAVFSLALFTMREDLLLGLIPVESYDMLKNSKEFKYLLGNTANDQPDLIDSLENLSARLKIGYDSFVKKMKKFRYEEDVLAKKSAK